MGQSDLGDYYDHATGTYLGSWSRSQGNFTDAAKQATNLFDLDQWKGRHQPKSTGLFGDLLEKIIPRARPITPAERYVAFVGDSFCAHVHPVHHDHLDPNPFRCRSGKKSSWPSLVIDGMADRGLAHYGFGGRSWWYSWQRFWRDWRDRLGKLDMVIFVHTSANRINNSVDDNLPHVNLLGGFGDTEKMQAWKYHTAYILDHEFQRWCQQQYFRHIREVMPDVPQMHFFAFDLPTPETCEILPGMKFTTPLFLLSAAETGIKNPKKIPDPPFDERCNHFNDHNNHAMADLVLTAALDYRPGAYPIPHLDFYQKKRNDFVQALDYYSQPTGHWI